MGVSMHTCVNAYAYDESLYVSMCEGCVCRLLVDSYVCIFVSTTCIIRVLPRGY